MNKSYNFSLPLITGLALASLFLTACSSEDPAQQALTPGGTQPLVNIETTAERLNPELVAEAGRDDFFEPQIDLEDPSKIATDTSGQTPGIDIGATPGGATTPDVGTSLNPIDDISLIGLVKISANKGMAILQTEADGPTQIVHLGETFKLKDYPDVKLKIAKMGRNEVTITANKPFGDGKKSQTLKLEKLIGYRPKGDKEGSSSSGKTKKEVTVTPSTDAGQNTTTAATDSNAQTTDATNQNLKTGALIDRNPPKA